VKRPLLTWWPFNPTEWLERTQLLAPEAQAAIMRLNCAAWVNADYPAHLPDSDAILSVVSGLGSARWKRHRESVLLHFPVTEAGWRIAALVAEVFDEQREKYEKRAAAGASGGWAARHRGNDTADTPDDAAGDASRDTLPEPLHVSHEGGENPPEPPSIATRNATSKATRNASRKASSIASRIAPTEVRTTERANTRALPKSPSGLAISNRNSNNAREEKSASSSPACAPLQGAPPPPPLGESTTSHSHSPGPGLGTGPRLDLRPLPMPRELHTPHPVHQKHQIHDPPADLGWNTAPRTPQRVGAPLHSVAAILATFSLSKTPGVPDDL
jgi:hypothetical protein